MTKEEIIQYLENTLKELFTCNDIKQVDILAQNMIVKMGMYAAKYPSKFLIPVDSIVKFDIPNIVTYNKARILSEPCIWDARTMNLSTQFILAVFQGDH